MTIAPPTATRNLRQDYLSGSQPLRSFYQYEIANIDFPSLIEAKSQENPDREALCRVIRTQYKGLTMSAATEENLRSLALPNTFTLTTGHQLILFGGPLYTLYKVASAIRLAEDLHTRFPEQHFVPVFWIHTEDHDYEEINHYYDRLGRKHTYEGSFRSKVGSHILNEDILKLIPDNIPPALAAAYQPGRDLADATRRFFHQLFDRYGLIILDADHPDLKAQFRPVILEELTQSASFEAVTETSRQMEEAGYPLQIHPREINLFYMDAEGRNRIVREGKGFGLADRKLHFSYDEMMRLAQEHPERFSPNVCLRPLYQEMILPNLVYIGGWGELSYWLQLKGVFDHFGVNFPAVIPRFAATVLPQGWLQEWEGMGFSVTDIGRPVFELERKFLPQVWSDAPMKARIEEILAHIRQLESYISSELSPTLARSAAALSVKNQRFLENIQKKALRVVKSRHSALFTRITTLRSQVQPGDTPQERIWSLAALEEVSPEDFVRQVMERCSPLDYTHQYLQL
ncbi:MAG: bacillithiol biosynthesis cysteine-adding enzyme BshC [Bacteroidetes bacterium]|nr:MAG: bacillithiol biosynthesis cysteine-adding enzyme BshC [Bacteroidota bacterium]